MIVLPKKLNSHFLINICMILLPSMILAQKHSVSIHNGKSHVQVNSNGKSYNIEYEGRFTLNDTEDDIIAISNGGYIEIEKKAFGSKRRVLIDADRRGRLVYKYYIGRREKPYEPDGRLWLAEVLPEVVNITGIGAEARVRRHFEKGGVESVLSMISDIENDFHKANHYDLLLDIKLPHDCVPTIVSHIGSTIKSDHYMSEILGDHKELFLDSDTGIDAYMDAIGTIGSDHYSSEVIRDILSDDRISNLHLPKLLDVSQNIGSDHYLSTVLRTAINHEDLNDEIITKMVELTNTMGSSHYKSEVYRDVLSSKTLTPESLEIITKGIVGINSDHYAGEVIKKAVKSDLTQEGIQDIIRAIDHNIGSDHYASEALKQILRYQNLEDQAMSSLIASIKSISSDHYASEVVKEIAKKDLSTPHMLDLVDAISEINSDHYLSECLTTVIDQSSMTDSRVRKAFLKAAKEISSDTYYGRVMKRLY